MQHTPGPWTVADDGTIEAKFLGRVGQLVGCCDADARLIAAAPDLMAALQEIERHLDTFGADGVVGSILAARAAIAQAIGDA